VYTVNIRGTGEVDYVGRNFVAVTGGQSATIPEQTVRELLSRFRDADFYSLRDEYIAKVTDNPRYIIRIEIDGHTKRVVDYLGQAVGMPSAVTELEHAIDEAAGSSKWVGRVPQ
jgi:TRAP-type uncharacterized transport system substrate-binding protein